MQAMERESDYEGQGVDQLAYVIDCLKDPNDHRAASLCLPGITHPIDEMVLHSRDVSVCVAIGYHVVSTSAVEMLDWVCLSTLHHIRCYSSSCSTLRIGGK